MQSSILIRLLFFLVYRSLYYVAGKIDKTDGVAYGSLEYSVQENGYDNNDDIMLVIMC